MTDTKRAKSSVQWLIRTETGKQIGPYSTEAVLKLIAEGAFTGTEQIKRYPDGKWTVIQQGMNTINKQARRYHWLSEGLNSFIDSPHVAIEGPNQGYIMNLTDPRAEI